MRGADPAERRDAILPIFSSCASTIVRIMDEDYRAGVLDGERALLLGRAVHAMFLEASATWADAPSGASSDMMNVLFRAEYMTGRIVADLMDHDGQPYGADDADDADDGDD